MTIKINLTDYSDMSGNSKTCAADFTENQFCADTNKKIGKRAEKHGVSIFRLVLMILLKCYRKWVYTVKITLQLKQTTR